MGNTCSQATDEDQMVSSPSPKPEAEPTIQIDEKVEDEIEARLTKHAPPKEMMMTMMKVRTFSPKCFQIWSSKMDCHNKMTCDLLLFSCILCRSSSDGCCPQTEGENCSREYCDAQPW